MPDNLLPEQIANKLRRRILQGEFVPGQTVKERDQAVLMNVSRTPMREGVRILAQEGLLILRPARSPIVANPSFDEICNVIEVLTTLEIQCGVLACKHATQEEIDQIIALNDEMQSKRATIDKIDLFDIDMAFHMAIAKASHNPVLAETHHAFIRRVWRARFLSVSHMGTNERGHEQHVQIAAALQARDAAEIRGLLELHLKDLATNISDQYAREAAD